MLMQLLEICEEKFPVWMKWRQNMLNSMWQPIVFLSQVMLILEMLKYWFEEAKKKCMLVNSVIYNNIINAHYKVGM